MQFFEFQVQMHESYWRARINFGPNIIDLYKKKLQNPLFVFNSTFFSSSFQNKLHLIDVFGNDDRPISFARVYLKLACTDCTNDAFLFFFASS